MVARVGNGISTHGVACEEGVGARSRYGGTHDGVVHGKVDGYASGSLALAADEVVDGYVGGGSAAGDFTDGVCRGIAVDVAGQRVVGNEGFEGATRSPATVVAAHCH